MNQLPDCVTTGGCVATPFKVKNLYDLYYNDGLFDNSKGTVSLTLGEGNLVTLASNGEFTVVANLGALPTATDGSLRSALLRVSGFSSVNKGRLTGPDGNEMDTEAFLASLKKIWKRYR
jgi:hypothetical protein